MVASCLLSVVVGGISVGRIDARVPAANDWAVAAAVIRVSARAHAVEHGVALLAHTRLPAVLVESRRALAQVSVVCWRAVAAWPTHK